MSAIFNSDNSSKLADIIGCGASRRTDFPFFSKNPSLTYLDNAATTQKPTLVLQAMQRFFEETNSNVHRGAYPIADQASKLFESARKTVAAFINSAHSDQIVFTKNATEALNIAAHGIFNSRISSGDEIIISTAEHHANLVPWQQYAAQKGVAVKYLSVNKSAQIDLAALEKLLTPRTKVLAITHCSNVLGSTTPLKRICALAHAAGAIVVADGAQSVAHSAVDVQALDVDVLAFSGHKLCGPTGIGVLYARTELLESWPPLIFGGGMIDSVSLEGATFTTPPHRFEAGTPPIAEAIGLAAALNYLSSIGMQNISAHCAKLRALALDGLSSIPQLEILGADSGINEAGILSFVVHDVHPHDLAWLCGEQGVCLRAGSHCAHPLLKTLGFDGCIRASFYLYNSVEDVQHFIEAVTKAIASLRKK